MSEQDQTLALLEMTGEAIGICKRPTVAIIFDVGIPPNQPMTAVIVVRPDIDSMPMLKTVHVLRACEVAVSAIARTVSGTDSFPHRLKQAAKRLRRVVREADGIVLEMAQQDFRAAQGVEETTSPEGATTNDIN